MLLQNWGLSAIVFNKTGKYYRSPFFQTLAVQSKTSNKILYFSFFTAHLFIFGKSKRITIKQTHMRKSDLINNISDKTGIPKVDVLVTVETLLKEIKENLAKGENIYVRGFGSFITKKRAAKIGRNIKKNVAVNIPEHFIPAFKPSKEFVNEVKQMHNAQ